MNDKKQNIQINWRYWTIVGIIVLLLCALNYQHFLKNSSSNKEFVVNYQMKVDKFKNFRTPQIVALMYENKQALKKPIVIIAPEQKYIPYLLSKYAADDLNVRTIIMDLNQEKAALATVDMIKIHKYYPIFMELNSLEPEELNHETSNDQIQNLKNFVSDNKIELLKIIQQSIISARKNKHFTLTRKDFSNNIFDKGNSYIYNNKDIEIGSLNLKTSIGQSIADNIFEAISQGLKDDSFNIAIMSDFHKIEYDTKEELLNQITPNFDGLILRDGYRQAIFLPHMWKEYPNKEDFLNHLKLKAKILPTYDSNKIKFYKFQTQEIEIANQQP